MTRPAGPAKRHVLLAVPCYDGRINTTLFGFFSLLDHLSLKPDYPYAFIRRTMPFRQPVEYARNSLVHSFLTDTSADYIWFIDNDMLPTVSSLRIFEADADMVTGRCFIWRHELDGQPQLFINSFRESRGPMGEPWLEPVKPDDVHDVIKDVDAAGAACLLVKRRVFEDERMRLPAAWTDLYGIERNLEEERGSPEYAPPFFRSGRKPNGQVYLGEDIDFTRRARALGYSLKVHMGAGFGHQKSIDLDGVAALYGNWLQASGVTAPKKRRVDFSAQSAPAERKRTIWTPSWGTTCGIAEYTAHLTESLPDVRVTAEPPDPRGASLLHVQHENGIFEREPLEEWMQLARAAGVPVVVTEHAVRAAPQAWERDATVLTALTPAGVARLRQRWPGKRVEYLPHGCPTFFPPRKQTRGRVIGAFGFLGPHKGFWTLLDMLRAIPGSELLLLSHSKDPQLEARWISDSMGLPVRHERRFMPIEESARMLAAEADVLVHWYDPISDADASGAVRVALATGVPVLASPTTWFEDLREVTYQPADPIEGVRRLLDDTELRDRLTAAARDHCHEYSWPRVAQRHVQLWESLERMD